MNLDAEGRAFTSVVWLGRARSEARAVPAFCSLLDDLDAMQAPHALVDIAHRALDEEAEHARLCLELASEYASRRLLMPEHAYVRPELTNAPAELRPLLRVLLVAALSETVSSSFIELAWRQATAPAVHALFHNLLEDEVDHARLGWAALALPYVTDEMRALLGGYLPELVSGILAQWQSAPLVPRDDLRGHGVLPWQTVSTHTTTALRDLVLPGFETLGVDVGPARRMLDARPPAHPTTALVYRDGTVRVVST